MNSSWMQGQGHSWGALDRVVLMDTWLGGQCSFRPYEGHPIIACLLDVGASDSSGRWAPKSDSSRVAQGPHSELLLSRPTYPLGQESWPRLTSRMMRWTSVPSGATPWTEDSAWAFTTSAAAFSVRSHCRVAQPRDTPGEERCAGEAGRIPGEGGRALRLPEASQCHKPA